MTTLSTRLKISAWDEQPAAQYDDGSKVTRAVVTLAEGVDGIVSGTIESVMYYRPDGTSHYVNVMHLNVDLGGRSGAITLTGSGTYDGTTASGTSAIVPGSATGELVGIAGTCHSASTHADYPFMPLTLTYELA